MFVKDLNLKEATLEALEIEEATLKDLKTEQATQARREACKPWEEQLVVVTHHLVDEAHTMHLPVMEAEEAAGWILLHPRSLKAHVMSSRDMCLIVPPPIRPINMCTHDQGTWRTLRLHLQVWR